MFMRHSLAVLVLSAFAAVTACSTGNKMAGTNAPSSPSDPSVVGVVGGTPVYYQELLDQYERNNIAEDKADSTQLREMREFLDLYLLYRAKLMEARAQGLFDDEQILAELRQYELQYAIPYWVENEIQDRLIDEYIERSKTEINASHILINVPQDASPADTARAYNRLIEARNRFLAGGDFETLSNEYSSMYEGRSMGGPLGYFGAGWAVKPFEDVAYNTPAGEVSMPFRTQFGYHVVYVKDSRERKPDRFLSHIYFNARTPGTAQFDSLMNVAQNAYRELQNGGAWNDMVAKYTQDMRSVDINGQIGWLNYGAYDDSFSNIVYDIPVSQIGVPTPPKQTSYGIHIFKLDSVRTYNDPQKERADALEALKRLPTFRDQRGLVLARIREELPESENSDVLNRYYATGNRDSSRIADRPVPADMAQLTVYSLGDSTYTVADYHAYIVQKSPATTWAGVNPAVFQGFKDAMVENQLLAITKQRYPQYAKTIENYLEGLAVFKLTEEEVWNRARTDSSELRNLFSQDPSKYQFPLRYEIVRFASRDDSVLTRAKAQVNSGVPPDSLRRRIEGLSVVRETISDLNNEPFNRLQGLQEKQFTDIFDFRTSRNLLYIDRVLQPEPMGFDDAFFRLVSEYQPIREADWNSYLREKYRILAYPQNVHL